MPELDAELVATAAKKLQRAAMRPQYTCLVQKKSVLITI